MANPNLNSISAVYGKTDVLDVTTTATAITSNAASSGKVMKVNMLVVSNIHGSAAVDINVDLFRGSTAYRLASTINVPADSSLVVIGKENQIYLMEGDSLRVTAGSASSAQAVCSYEELS
jgi:hypothetical protein